MVRETRGHHSDYLIATTVDLSLFLFFFVLFFFLFFFLPRFGVTYFGVGADINAGSRRRLKIV